MIRVVLLVLVALALAACSGVDRGRCLEHHMQMVMIPATIGKTTILVPRYQTACDRWEYPEGRP